MDRLGAPHEDYLHHETAYLSSPAESAGLSLFGMLAGEIGNEVKEIVT